eukprot:241687_1
MEERSDIDISNLRCHIDGPVPQKMQSSPITAEEFQELQDLKLKFLMEQENAKVLELENTEFQKEIAELLKENEELQSMNCEITRQNTENHDNEAHLVQTLTSKSTALDITDEMVQSLHKQVNEQNQRIKLLHKQKMNLHSENELFKQRLEQSLQEKERSAQYIQQLRINVDELQHRLHLQNMAMANVNYKPEEIKYNEEDVVSNFAGGTTPTGKTYPGMRRAPTVKWTVTNSPVPQSLPENEEANIPIGTLGRDVSTTSTVSTGGFPVVHGTGNFGNFRQKTLQGLPETMPLTQDTGTTPGTTPGASYGYAYTNQQHASPESINESFSVSDTSEMAYDAASMQLKIQYKDKLTEMSSKHNQEVMELRQKLNKKLNTIKNLRKKNAKLKKKAETTRGPCIFPQWCDVD